MKLLLVIVCASTLWTAVNSSPHLNNRTETETTTSGTADSSPTTTPAATPAHQTESHLHVDEPEQAIDPVQNNKTASSQGESGVDSSSSVNVGVINGTEEGGLRTVGVLLNFTKELFNYTSANFNKNNRDEPVSLLSSEPESELTFSSAAEDEESQEGDIQDLLRGLLADELGGEDEDTSSLVSSQSVELDIDDVDEVDVFHDDENDEEEEETAAAAPETEVTEIEINDQEGDGSSDNSITTITTVSGKDGVTITETETKIDTETAGSDTPSPAEEDDEKESDPAVLGETDVTLDVVEFKTAGQNRTSRAKEEEEKEEEEGEARSAFGRANNKKSRKNKENRAATITKYNRYVDAVFKRMNSMIRGKQMDPLRVNLFAGSNTQSQGAQHKSSPNKKKKNNNNNTNNRNKNNNNNNKNKNNKKRGGSNNNNNNNKKKNGNNNNRNRNFNSRRGNRPRMDDDEDDEILDEGRNYRTGRNENATEEVKMMDNKMRPISMEANKDKSSASSSTPSPPSTPQASLPSTPKSNESAESKEMKDSSSTSQINSNRPTRGVLHGLSTLRRAGAVKVLRRGPGVRLVRAKFLLGPVALDILPKKSGSGSTKTSNVVSATATARSLKGIMEIRLKSAGPTRIKKLRVFPPSNVRVEGESNGMKKSGYRKITPVAARRLMSVANSVLKQSDKVRGNNNKNKHKNNKRRNNKNTPTNNKRRRGPNSNNNSNKNKRRSQTRRHHS